MKKVAIFLAMLLSLSCYGCSASDEIAVPKKDITIEVLVTSQSTNFWDTVKQGVNDAQDELGVNIIFEAPPTEADLDVQLDLLKGAIDKGVDAIIISPLDADALNDTLADATSKGIPVLTIDNTVTYSGIKSAIGTQNETGGGLAAQKLAELMNQSGEVAVLRHSNAAVATKRCSGFTEELKNHSGMKLDNIIEVNGDMDSVPSLVEEFLKTNPNVKGFFCTNQGSTIRICDTLKSLNRDDIYVIGFDASDKEVEHIQNGTLTGTMVQNPYLMGYLGVRNAYKVIEGENIDSIIDTGITYVDSSNLDDEDIQILVYPNGKE